MKHIISILLISLTFTTQAQRPAADKISTGKGEITVQPVYHAGMVLQWEGKTIYTDPTNGAKGFSGMPAPDMILLTDIHPDHLDTTTLNGLETSKTLFIIPKAAADKLPSKMKSHVKILENNQSTTEMGIMITAVPMYNLPESPDAPHVKGRGNGYILTFSDKRVYISGDTEDTPEMRQLKNIDVAFVCMNQPYTMDVKQAASAVLDFKPAIVYPYHYKGKDMMCDTEEFKKLVNKDNKKIDVRLRDWYAK